MNSTALLPQLLMIAHEAGDTLLNIYHRAGRG